MDLGRQIVPFLTNSLLAVSTAIAIVAIVWLVLYVRVQRWQQQFDSQFKRARSKLSAIRDDMVNITQEAKHYSPNSLEPYGTVARKLHRTLTNVQEMYPHLVKRLNNLSAKPIAPPEKLLTQFLSTFWRKPRHWRQLIRGLATLDMSIQKLRAQTDRTILLLGELHAIPHKVAIQSKELAQTIEKGLQIAHELAASGVHGDALSLATTHLHHLQSDLLTLPPYFLRGSKSLMIDQVQKKEVITVWRTLEEMKRPVETCIEQLQKWQSEHQDITQSLIEMWAAIETAIEILGEAPVAFDHSLVIELEQARHEATELEQTFLSPNVQDLGDLAKRISSTTCTTNRIIEEIQNTLRKLELLYKTISANAALLDQVTTQMNRTSRAKKYPIAWEQYQDELEHLRHAETSIRGTPSQWTPEQIRAYMTQTHVLAQKAQVLDDSVSGVLAQRDRLIQLLGQLDPTPEPDWLTLAQRLHQQVETSEFTATDWPSELAIPDILTDASQLVQRHNRLAPRTGTLLPASQLGYHLIEGQQLVDDIKTFQNRLQRIGSILNSWELETTHQIIASLVRRIKSTKPSLGPAVVKRQRNLERLQRRSRQLVLEPRQPTTKLMQKRAKRIAEWTQLCHKGLETLPQVLQTEIKEMEAQLRDEIQDLQKLGPFDREPAMRAARQLLDVKRTSKPLPIDQTGNNRQQIILLANQANELLQERESLYVSFRNVQSQIRDQIKDALDKLEQARQDASKKLEGLKKLQKDAKTVWPPLICDTKGAEDLLEYASKEEKGLQDSSRTVSDLLRYSKRLTKNYQDIIAKIATEEEQYRKERQNLQEILDQIDRWQGQLEAYRQACYQDRAIVEAIQARLTEINKAIRAEKKRRRGKPLTYDEAKWVLQSLWKLAHEGDLPVEGSDQPLRVRDIELRRR